MKFDVILHGKPYAGSHKATNGLEDTFCENLVDKFFQSMNSIKEAETLIVDARNWKGKWYSVYTFWLGSNITDTARRTSFIAISIVIPEQYVCLISALYSLLKKACKEHVFGIYISKSGEYLVQDLNDDSSFSKLNAFLNNNFVNLCEEFDGSFKQTIETTSSIFYNLIDCDSLAFVEELKKSGRVFVSSTYDSKDSRLTNTDKYYSELIDTKSKLSEKDKQIEQLLQTQKSLEDQINSKNNNAGKTRDELKALQKENNILKDKITQLVTALENYLKNVQEIQKLLSMNFVEQPKDEPSPVKSTKSTLKSLRLRSPRTNTPPVKPTKPTFNWVAKNLPLCIIALLLIIAAFCWFGRFHQ